MAAVRITTTLVIPEEELEFRFSRSGGPGGQHVNTTATKVELRFDVARSTTLSDEQRQRIRQRLANRITDDGVLVLTASEERSQLRNREAVVARFATLLADALTPDRVRRPTRPSKVAKLRRLQEKRALSERKAGRRARFFPD